MITIEQLKDVKERTAALERYLDIENKLVLGKLCTGSRHPWKEKMGGKIYLYHP